VHASVELKSLLDAVPRKKSEARQKTKKRKLTATELQDLLVQQKLDDAIPTRRANKKIKPPRQPTIKDFTVKLKTQISESRFFLDAIRKMPATAWRMFELTPNLWGRITEYVRDDIRGSWKDMPDKLVSPELQSKFSRAQLVYHEEQCAYLHAEHLARGESPYFPDFWAKYKQTVHLYTWEDIAQGLGNNPESRYSHEDWVKIWAIISMYVCEQLHEMFVPRVLRSAQPTQPDVGSEESIRQVFALMPPDYVAERGAVLCRLNDIKWAPNRQAASEVEAYRTELLPCRFRCSFPPFSPPGTYDRLSNSFWTLSREVGTDIRLRFDYNEMSDASYEVMGEPPRYPKSGIRAIRSASSGTSADRASSSVWISAATAKIRDRFVKKKQQLFEFISSCVCRCTDAACEHKGSWSWSKSKREAGDILLVDHSHSMLMEIGYIVRVFSMGNDKNIGIIICNYAYPELF
jgi:hypothetical protein